MEKNILITMMKMKMRITLKSYRLCCKYGFKSSMMTSSLKSIYNLKMPKVSVKASIKSLKL